MLRSAVTFGLAVCVPLALFAAACDGGGDDGGTTSGTTTSTTTTTTSAGGGGAGGAGGAGGSTGDPCAPTDLDTYDGAAFAANTGAEYALRDQLGALNALMRSAEQDLAVLPTVAELTALYEAGTPSLRSVTTAYYDGALTDFFADFEAAAGDVWTPASPPMGPGGQYGAYIFSAYGIDLRQAVEKGLFGAAFYNHALTLAGAATDEASLDRLLATFGAHPTFPGDSETADPALNPNPDRIGAQYAERRSPKDPSDPSRPADPANPGPYFRIKEGFIRAQAAIRGGAACDEIRDEAIQQILVEWERVNAGTVIYYLNSAAILLTKDNATVADLSSGLHGYGEATSFLRGFRGLPAQRRMITDAQLDELLDLVGAPTDADATAYQLITDAAATVPNLLLASNELATIYAFTPQEVESFKVNY